MMIKYINIFDELKNRGIMEIPNLGLFMAKGSVIKVAQWQPKGKIIFSKEDGFKSNLPEHEGKCREFLQYASETRADIVITPEYSTPFKILHHILDKKEGPKSGKLWCLGLEGIRCEDMEAFYKEYSKKENLILIMEDLSALNQNYFFSCIVYLFRADKNIVCVLQMKTIAAADSWVKLEAGGLTPGNTIYYFADQYNQKCLFSFICADALNQEIVIQKGGIPYQQCIILHPQLNPKPLHDSFDLMRNNFLNFSKSVRIISLNWAKDTLIQCVEGGEKVIPKSYSALYHNKKVDNDELAKLMRSNKSKGMHLAKKDYVYIWYMNNLEHIVLYSIDSFESNAINVVTANHKEPIVAEYLEYNDIQNKWVQKNACENCPIDWAWLKDTFNLAKCDSRNCGVAELHLFFEIMFCSEKFSGLNIEKEFIHAIFNTNDEKTEEIVRLRERSKDIKEEIQNGNVPIKFMRIKEGNFQWVLNKEGNLSLNNKDILCIACVEVADENIIKRKIACFEKLMGKAATDRLILYFHTGKGLQYYDKIYNTDINNPELTHSVDLIK